MEIEQGADNETFTIGCNTFFFFLLCRRDIRQTRTYENTTMYGKPPVIPLPYVV